jgi:hypothetical protein
MTDKILWGVKDKNAIRSARRHSVGGVDYDLIATGHAPMPQEHASHFMRDPSFEVVDEFGRPVATVAEQSVNQPGRLPPLLKPGQVVANLDELLTTALLARAQQLPNGKGFGQATKKADLITALIEAGSEPRSPQNPAPEGGEVEVEDVPEEELAALDGE